MAGDDGASQRLRVQEEMSRILESPAFKSSPRCRQFLKYVVEQALDGRYELLKERMIGVEVFGRDPAYVTEGDSVVRVRATEVRKRLLQYYSLSQHVSECRIEMPSGSYVPQFRIVDAARQETSAVPVLGDVKTDLSPAQRRHVFTPVSVIATVLVLALVATSLTLWFHTARLQAEPAADHNEKLLEAFWGPAIHDSRPVLICIGSPTTYAFTKEYRAAYARQHGINSDAEPQLTIGPGNQPMPGNAVMPVKNEYIGAGDANVAVMLSALFSRFGKVAEFRLSEDTSYSEISDAPTVLIGAFTNRWTILNSTNLPFVFTERSAVRQIEERDGSRRKWTLPQLRADGKTDEDFAIVSRLLDSQTGKFLVTAAGISGFGSRAAGYFLTRPDLLAKALDRVPTNWQQKNIELVLKTRIVDDAPTAPELVAWRAW